MEVISFQIFYLTFFNLLSLIKNTWKWEHGLAFILNSVALLHTYTQIGSCFIFIIMPCLLVILLIGAKRIGIPRNIRDFFLYDYYSLFTHVFEVINGGLLATWINFKFKSIYINIWRCVFVFWLLIHSFVCNTIYCI